MRRLVRIAIVGTVGVPPRYGGFETLAAHLAIHAATVGAACEVDIYCSSRSYEQRSTDWHGARLRYVPLAANGPASALYDLWSMIAANWRRADTILVLGVSGALALPLLRLFTRARYVVNVDGIEWKRAKWSWLAARFLKLSEWAAARFAHVVIADNQGIVDHIAQAYGREAVLIPYGGDHAGPPEGSPPASGPPPDLPDDYALMLCRIEPENNIRPILESFAGGGALPLVAVGNWDASAYGRTLRARFSGTVGLTLLDPVFEPHQLHRLRVGARLYVHGHSAGGTNPALVEMMHLGKAVIAFDCLYNRYTTEGRARYFRTPSELAQAVAACDTAAAEAIGIEMAAIAAARYRWDRIGRAYFALLLPGTADSGRHDL